MNVRAMFNGIAGRYDLLNHLLSAGQDILWRKWCCKQLGARSVVLDLCGGTGDFLREALKRTDTKLGVLGDFSEKMLSASQGKFEGTTACHTVQLDAENLPLIDNCADAALNGFGMRNLGHLQAGLAEAFRVLRPGGLFITLEFFRPVNVLTKVFYKGLAPLSIPFVGMLLSDREAYRYLVRSIVEFVSAEEYAELAKEAGFRLRRIKAFDFGIAYAVILEKP
jgi:demethylmenaquinone methyltransferase/2-methoxy-6-polyprenyl-1,4-benzoquinol methylase